MVIIILMLARFNFVVVVVELRFRLTKTKFESVLYAALRHFYGKEEEFIYFIVVNKLFF